MKTLKKWAGRTVALVAMVMVGIFAPTIASQMADEMLSRE